MSNITFAKAYSYNGGKRIVSQEIVWCSRALVPVLISWGRIELGEFAMVVNVVFGTLIDCVVDFHNGSLVAASGFRGPVLRVNCNIPVTHGFWAAMHASRTR